MQLYDLHVKNHYLDKNFEPNRPRTTKIVLHHNAGHGVDPYNTWQVREASAHFQVWGSGQVDALVHMKDIAWHAHEANSYSIGIEHENSKTGGNWPITDDALEASARLVGYLCAFYKLGAPKLGKNVTTHSAIESDGIGVDSHTACPGPYFLTVLHNERHWYWNKARAAYLKATGNPVSGGISGGVGTVKRRTHKPPRLHQKWSLPAGHYYGLISGPARSHGGYFTGERPMIRLIQKRLQAAGAAPKGSDWADGMYEMPTVAAVRRFQKKHGLPTSGRVDKTTFLVLFTY